MWDIKRDDWRRGTRMSSYLGSGAIVFVQVRDRPRESDHHQQEHIIRMFNGRATCGKRTGTKAVVNRVRDEPERRESGVRERGGNGLHARSPAGAHDQFAERTCSRPEAGGGHWLPAIGRWRGQDQRCWPVVGRGLVAAPSAGRITLPVGDPSGGANWSSPHGRNSSDGLPCFGYDPVHDR